MNSATLKMKFHLILTSTCLLALNLQADTINIDIQQNQGSTPKVDMTGTAAAPDSAGSPTWNILAPGSGLALQNSDGAAVSATLDISGFVGTFTRSTTGANALQVDYVFDNQTPNSNRQLDFALNNLDAGTYDLYVYTGMPFNMANNGANQVTITSHGSVTATASWVGGGDASLNVENVNYVKLSGLTVAPSGSIVGNITGPLGTEEPTLAGLQLVSVVPEPSALALLGLGGALLLALKRK